jgi:diguanylate cyclase (GGDEF)-like protein
MVDIDHFKKVNDGGGHQAGDAVLRAVSDRLVCVTRLKGHVFRYGGEELALLLPNHSIEEGIAVAERARLTIESTPAIEGLHVTASFGVSGFPSVIDADALIRAADTALYDAKNRGRNMVRFDGEPPPEKPGPREPERKKPEAGRLTEAQKTEMRRKLLRNQRIECPEDGAYFEVLDVTAQQSVGREFLITCPDCGLSDTLSSSSR